MGLLENMQSETVSRLSLREPLTAAPSATVRQAVEIMREKNLGCIFVVDENRKPLGEFTEAMLVQILRENPAAMDEPLEQHAAKHWPWVKLTDPISDVLDSLETKNVRFLCVVDDLGQVVGLTGQKGLMEYIAEHFPGQVTVQRIGGQPYPLEREGA
ncbi:MAG: CBS domain-containing protein [Planctomycetales bacterium]|nr:CBS domain-containing protein [Planctomycetales bacterium]